MRDKSASELSHQDPIDFVDGLLEKMGPTAARGHADEAESAGNIDNGSGELPSDHREGVCHADRRYRADAR
jgi:hypothetical protein